MFITRRHHEDEVMTPENQEMFDRLYRESVVHAETTFKNYEQHACSSQELMQSNARLLMNYFLMEGMQGSFSGENYAFMRNLFSIHERMYGTYLPRDNLFWNPLAQKFSSLEQKAVSPQ